MDAKAELPDEPSSPVHVVVVLNWNGKTDTLACVESLLVGSPDITILVVDNGSFDGTLDVVASRWPSVHTLQLDRNAGFSGGMNRGLRHAFDLSADVVTVLNNDTIVPAGAMSTLRNAATGDLAVSPEVMYRSAPDEIWFGGGTLDAEEAFPHHTRPADLGPCRDGLRHTTLLAGCCITARKEVWERAGLFDERFFLNFEDSEWSVRASARGILLAVVCDVRILHAVSASFHGTAATLGSFYYLRNGLLFNRLVGGDLRSRVRFVRRITRDGVRDRALREVARSLVISGWAVATYALGRFGPAPTPVQRSAARWNMRRQSPVPVRKP